MTIMKPITGMLLFFMTFFAAGCGQDLPFEYRYTSANMVQIKYMDKMYELNRFGEKADTPFDYEFEADGDLDISIAGKTYEIESPYDIDTPKKKTPSKKKKTSSRKRKK